MVGNVVRISSDSLNLQMGARYRSRSAPRPEQNMFIPQPDYNNYEPISVDTSQNDTHRYFGFRASNNVMNTTMSPSERRIRKFEVALLNKMTVWTFRHIGYRMRFANSLR